MVEGYEPCRYCGSKEHTSGNHQFDTSKITGGMKGVLNRLRGRFYQFLFELTFPLVIITIYCKIYLRGI